MPRKYMPFPLRLDDLSIVSRLTATQYGIVRLLVESFWWTGQPIPEDDEARARIARTHVNNYRRYRQLLNKVLCEIMPVIERHYLDVLNKRVRRQELSKQMIKDKPHSFAIRNPPKQALSDAAAPAQTNITPVPSSGQPFNPGMSDTSARKKALEASKNIKKPTFKDA